MNNTFTGDAGGQLIHRKVLRQKGASLEGERPADERGREFAASKDTWCRMVNFANAPDAVSMPWTCIGRPSSTLGPSRTRSNSTWI
ncbi:DUF7133 domain-containing protein [Verrucomicrobium spinosum]|uniref:DUF7133 domain-containing protein n=1 Tax=Verrucomicrobium spinosum TaxID=2736 RepID=UPI0012E12366|nr:hypothetical protein [Verrucomicrobium spinosum]